MEHHTAESPEPRGVEEVGLNLQWCPNGQPDHGIGEGEGEECRHNTTHI